jgi:hypothetical protein
MRRPFPRATLCVKRKGSPLKGGKTNREEDRERLGLEELEAQAIELLPDRIEMRRINIRKRRKKRGFTCGDNATCFHIRHR